MIAFQASAADHCIKADIKPSEPGVGWQHRITPPLC
jgi:hypothetical protein